jgi:hypothetical protein
MGARLRGGALALAAALAIVSLPCGAPAQTAADPDTEAREFVRLTLATRAWEIGIAQIAPLAVKQVTAAIESKLNRSLTPAEEEKVLVSFKRAIAATVSEQAVEDAFVELAKRHYTPEEIRELLRFQRSPVGEKSRRLVPVMAAESAAVGRKLVESRQDELTRNFQDELRKEFAR